MCKAAMVNRTRNNGESVTKSSRMFKNVHWRQMDAIKTKHTHMMAAHENPVHKACDMCNE